MNAPLCANGTPMSWQEHLQQEWRSAQDQATREYLLTLYKDEIAKLSEHEREQLFENLQDTSKHC
jgi:hypothetical protein